jgi:hypothetical protein
MRALTMGELEFVAGGFAEDGTPSQPENWLLPDPWKELRWDQIMGPFSGASSAQRMLASEGYGFGGGETVIVYAFKNASGDKDRNGSLTRAEHAGCIADKLNDWGTVGAIGSGAIGGGRLAVQILGVTSATPYGGYAIAGAAVVGGAAALLTAAMSASAACRAPNPFR